MSTPAPQPSPTIAETIAADHTPETAAALAAAWTHHLAAVVAAWKTPRGNWRRRPRYDAT